MLLGQLSFFFSSRRRHTRSLCDWSSDVCSSDLSRADDVLFGYDPLFLGGWERDRAGFSDTVIPRADAKLALRSLREAGTLGRGVWVFDASDTNNFTQKLTIPLRYPNPRSDFEARAFGPFLVIRSPEPTRTPKEFLLETRQAQIL